MIIRSRYLDQLMAFKDKDLVKVVTGVRRCGKSTLLDMMREHLKERGIAEERLLSFKMESMEFGGLPYLALEAPDIEAHRAYCKSLYDTVIVRDILERDRRRGRRSLTNPDLLERVCAFLADNVGNENSVNSIAGTLGSERLKAANDTVDAYIGALCGGYLFYPVRRYDIKGKETLKTGGKHYIVDSGLRSYLQGYRDSDQGRVFENMVFQQLLYDGFDVSIGKLRNGEVDFVATRGGTRMYVQVTEDMTDPSTLERELKPLLSIRDAYPKAVVVMRSSYPSEIDGIKILTAADFLLHRREIA